MTKQTDWVDYEARLQRVIVHIHDHLEEDIDLDQLAEIACLSPYHWHRIYRAIQGETIAATIKRLRLLHAAGRLAHTDMTIEELRKGRAMAASTPSPAHSLPLTACRPHRSARTAATWFSPTQRDRN